MFSKTIRKNERNILAQAILKLSCFKIRKPKHHQQAVSNIVLSIPVIFYIRAFAKELLMTPVGNTHDSMLKLVAN